jgi:hypothetical protein
MTGTIGHLRNVADLVDALDLDAILGEAGIDESTSRHINGHREREILEAAIWAGVGALRRLADIVEEATAAPVIDPDRVGALLVEAAKTDRWDLVHACADYLVEEATEAGLALIREALVEKVAQ